MSAAKADPEILVGAWLISAYTGLTPRQIYHGHERRYLPTFKIGAKICLRPTTYREWLDRQEGRS